jgi:hypothetical protein
MSPSAHYVADKGYHMASPSPSVIEVDRMYYGSLSDARKQLLDRSGNSAHYLPSMLQGYTSTCHLTPSGAPCGAVRVILSSPIPLREWEGQTRCSLHVVGRTQPLCNAARDSPNMLIG